MTICQKFGEHKDILCLGLWVEFRRSFFSPIYVYFLIFLSFILLRTIYIY